MTRNIVYNVATICDFFFGQLMEITNGIRLYYISKHLIYIPWTVMNLKNAPVIMHVTCLFFFSSLLREAGNNKIIYTIT